MMQAEAIIQQDIRDIIFASICDRQYTAHLLTERQGVIAGVKRLQTFLADNKILADIQIADGEQVAAGQVIVSITGTPKQIAVAEEFIVGFLAKPSGLATAVRRAVEAAGPDMNIVCGAWKKMPHEIKHIVREAVTIGGGLFRITDQPFLYLDKNFVRMLGGVEATLKSVSNITDKIKAIQIKGETGNIGAEALAAYNLGAGILMVDTGRQEDVAIVNQVLTEAGCRHKIKLAFAKGIQIEDITTLLGHGIDVLDIGAAILDAPLLDMKLEVQG